MERRTLSNAIIQSDDFMDMPMKSQALYFHLCMGARHDGHVYNSRAIMRSIGADEEDLAIIVKQGLAEYDVDGSVIICHWRVHWGNEKGGEDYGE